MALLTKKPATCRTCARARFAAAGKPMPLERRCHDCGHRYAQEHGLCRQCSRARGDGRTIRELEAAILTRQADRLEALERAVYVPKVPRSLWAHGIEYEVAWDGSVKPLEPER